MIRSKLMDTPLRLKFYLLLFLPFLIAAKEAIDFSPKKADRALNKLEASLPKESVDVKRLAELNEQIGQFKTNADLCVQVNEAELKIVEEQLSALGENASTDNTEIAQKRATLTKESRDKTNKSLACKLINTRATQVQERLQLAFKDQAFDGLLSKGAPYSEVGAPDIGLFNQLENYYKFSEYFSIVLSSSLSLFFVLILFTGGILGAAYKLKKIGFFEAQQDNRFVRSFSKALIFVNAPLGFIFAFSVLVLLLVPFEREAHTFLTLAIASTALGLWLFNGLLSVDDSASIFKSIIPNRLTVHIASYFFSVAAFLTLISHKDAFYVSRVEKEFLVVDPLWLNVAVLALSFLAFLLSFSLKGDSHFLRSKLWRYGCRIAFLVAIGASVIRYDNLAFFITKGVFLSSIVIITWKVLRIITDDLADLLSGSRYLWQQQLREELELDESKPLPGMLWISLGLSLSYLLFALFFILKAWDVPDANLQNVSTLMSQGIGVGELQIVPSDILYGLLLFLATVFLLGRLNKYLRVRWFTRAKMDQGAQDSLSSLLRYTSAGIAFIIGLAATGIDLSSLALIAGALSVGLGFGLQNIISNFVSGIILLFERPIKPGDWIVVGSTEGYVKRISIRSTRIQTFLRSDVIVPNSELISTAVVNNMFNNSLGRISIPIGVSYDSDVLTVKDILLNLAMDHPDVIKHHRRIPDPYVLFIGYGDSSLNFELRGIIRNVEMRLNVISDINFSLFQAFKESGIAIPFPQRDIHIRSVTKDTEDKVTILDKKENDIDNSAEQK